MASLLEPGSHRIAGVVDDDALIAAMIKVEVAWLGALSDCGAADPEDVISLQHVATTREIMLAPTDIEAAGNPVLPLLRALQETLPLPAASLIHRGLTSQDVLDTALMLSAHEGLGRISSDLGSIANNLAEQANTHRSSLQTGRTLTQHAVPVTFGLTAAQWLVGVLEVRRRADDLRGVLPVQCGGAAGTLALAGDVVDQPLRAAAAFAERLGLVWPGLPWHTRRTPITQLADVLTSTCDTLGQIASNVLLLGRPEIAEIREAPIEGRGASSTMPHKQNPVLAVLIHGIALQAPHLAAQLHIAASQSTDERPAGEWHSEWPTLRRLIELAMTATDLSADLTASLEVDVAAMRRRAASAAAVLLSERDGREDDELSSYLGSAEVFIDEALRRWEEIRG